MLVIIVDLLLLAGGVRLAWQMEENFRTAYRCLMRGDDRCRGDYARGMAYLLAVIVCWGTLIGRVTQRIGSGPTHSGTALAQRGESAGYR